MLRQMLFFFIIIIEIGAAELVPTLLEGTQGSA